MIDSRLDIYLIVPQWNCYLTYVIVQIEIS